MQARKTILAVITAAVALGATAATASAHITAAPDTTAAGAYAFVRFGIPHGCDEAGTTSFTIQIPQDEYVFDAITPFENPNWTVSTKVGKLKEPVESHGSTITEGETEVTYTRNGEPLPADIGDAVHLSIKLPADAEGETIYFPTVQKCEGGKETGWIQIPQEGESGEELESPAPQIAVTAASGDGHGGGDEADEDEQADESEAASSSADDDEDDDEVESGDLLPLYLLGGLGVLLALLSLLRGRRK